MILVGIQQSKDNSETCQYIIQSILIFAKVKWEQRKKKKYQQQKQRTQKLDILKGRATS